MAPISEGSATRSTISIIVAFVQQLGRVVPISRCLLEGGQLSRPREKTGSCCNPTRRTLARIGCGLAKCTNPFSQRGTAFTWLVRSVGRQERPHLCCANSFSAFYVSARQIVYALISTLAAIRASPASSPRTAPQPAFAALACTIHQSSCPSAPLNRAESFGAAVGSANSAISVNRPPFCLVKGNSTF